jgi:hypothetical protein
MDVRISRISPIRTDFFFCHSVGNSDSYGMTRKNPYRIREIREIRTSIRIPKYPKLEPKNPLKSVELKKKDV